MVAADHGKTGHNRFAEGQTIAFVARRMNVQIDKRKERLFRRRIRVTHKMDVGLPDTSRHSLQFCKESCALHKGGFPGNDQRYRRRAPSFSNLKRTKQKIVPFLRRDPAQCQQCRSAWMDQRREAIARDGDR